jgi:hypothetical protein
MCRDSRVTSARAALPNDAGQDRTERAAFGRSGGVLACTND